MKLRYLFVSAVALTAAAVFFSSNANGPASNGATATGAPGDNNMCTTCHSGGSFGTVSVDLEVLDAQSNEVTEYTPGVAYTLLVSVSSASGTPGAYGFQMISMSNAGNTPLNSFSNAGSGVKFSTVSSRQYAEHSAPKPSGEFSFTWTAPSAGTGTVTFYAGANAVNLNSNNGGDNAVTTSFTLPEVAGDTNDTNTTEWPEGLFDLAHHSDGLTLYPNPASEVINVEGLNDNASLQILNANGALVMSTSYTQQPISIDHLEPGIYFIRSDNSIGRFLKI